MKYMQMKINWSITVFAVFVCLFVLFLHYTAKYVKHEVPVCCLWSAYGTDIPMALLLEGLEEQTTKHFLDIHL